MTAAKNASDRNVAALQDQVRKDEAEIAALKSDLAALRAANDNHTRTLSAFEEEVSECE